MCLGLEHVPQHHHPAAGCNPAPPRKRSRPQRRQYVRKVSGVQKTSANTEIAFEAAVAVITAATTDLLEALPPRQQPPPTLPPLRRINAKKTTVSAGTSVR